MNLYWFSDWFQEKESCQWSLIAAKGEDEAWLLLAACSPSNKLFDLEIGLDRKMYEEEARNTFQLDSVTSIDGTATGEIAGITLRDPILFIRKSPGGEISESGKI